MKLLSILLIFVLSSSLWATTTEKECPSVTVIQKFGIEHELEKDGAYWEAYHFWAHYDEDYSKWAFTLNHIEGADEAQAYKNALGALKTLKYAGGPYEGPLKILICRYISATGETGFLHRASM